MGKTKGRFTGSRGVLSAAALVAALGLAAAPAMRGADGVDPDAEEVLRAMSKYMGRLRPTAHRPRSTPRSST